MTYIFKGGAAPIFLPQFLFLQSSTINCWGLSNVVTATSLEQRQSLLSLWIVPDWRQTPAGHLSRSVQNVPNAIRRQRRDGSSPLLFSHWLSSEGIDWEGKETPEAVWTRCDSASPPFDGGNQDDCCHWFNDFCTRADSQPVFFLSPAARLSDFLVKVVEVSDSSRQKTLRGHEAPVLSVSFDPKDLFVVGKHSHSNKNERLLTSEF